MASAPQTFKKGSQDTSQNRATFALFWQLTKWGIAIVAIVLILMAYFLT